MPFLSELNGSLLRNSHPFIVLPHKQLIPLSFCLLWDFFFFVLVFPSFTVACLGTDFLGAYCVLGSLCISNLCGHCGCCYQVWKVFSHYFLNCFSEVNSQAPFTMPVTPKLALFSIPGSLRLCLWFFLPCCSDLMICISLSASSLTFFCHLRSAYWAHPVNYFSCFIF